MRELDQLTARAIEEVKWFGSPRAPAHAVHAATPATAPGRRQVYAAPAAGAELPAGSCAGVSLGPDAAHSGTNVGAGGGSALVAQWEAAAATYTRSGGATIDAVTAFLRSTPTHAAAAPALGGGKGWGVFHHLVAISFSKHLYYFKVSLIN